MKLVSSKPVGQRRVYDIEVADVHNFYANGVNVHNCATDGGVSVIKDDGTVVDISSTLSTFVSFVRDGTLLVQYDTGSAEGIYRYAVPETDQGSITPTLMRYNNSGWSV